MFLDDVVAAQKRGEAKGIASICSAHPYVLKKAMQVFERPLIEATCNQVNQYGGYTGMTPVKFVEYVRGFAEEIEISFDRIILGGDHLGPSVWRNEPAEIAMQKSAVLVREYVKAGFVKIHLDCSMRLEDDPQGALDAEVSARRSAQLTKAAEDSGEGNVRYVIGTEVPVPGGATGHEEGVHVTKTEAVRETIEIHRRAFKELDLQSAWERVVAVVVQPGVEFGDDFVLPYRPGAARELSCFIESQPMVYEAHSTDYQTLDTLKSLVKDHFAILKVGPGLTFAFREAVFALALMEDELFGKEQRSNIIRVLDDVMVRNPSHWKKYYRGDETDLAFKRMHSLSDRARYYWVRPAVQDAFRRLMANLGDRVLPYSLLSQFVGETNLNAAQVLERKIGAVLRNYEAACA